MLGCFNARLLFNYRTVLKNRVYAKVKRQIVFGSEL